jgi:hypothetical protein
MQIVHTKGFKKMFAKLPKNIQNQFANRLQML